uniref:Uncharacterized protein n=1 Tax=Plectus sambesii TaxID=2011161 RepID=A0A914UPT6_9BILA
MTLKYISQELDEQKAGESLIAAEIRTLREREDELKRSRSELGLPSLEDTIDYWRHGLASKPTSLPLRGAQSYDHLHWAVGSETPSNMSISIKSESLDHLHALNENGVNGHHNNYQPQREQTNGHLPTKQSHEIGYNLAVHPNRSSQLNSHRYRAPMEARIEAEVIEDQRREAELRAQRGELSPQNRLLASTTPDGLSELSDSSGGGHSAGEPLQREYIGQRNPTFRPAYSSSAYKLHRSDDPDV